jgi:WD40-like Beta Propeller Repeat
MRLTVTGYHRARVMTDLAPRIVLAILTVLLSASAPTASAQPAPHWIGAAGGSSLLRPAFWEGFPNASASSGRLTLEAPNSSMPVISRYGPRLDVAGDFRVVATLQAATDGLAVLDLLDAVPEDAWWEGMARIELGLDKSSVVLGIFDGSTPTPNDWRTFEVPAPLGPITLALSRLGDSMVLDLSGEEVARFADPHVLGSGHVLIGARVAEGNQVLLHALEVQTPADRPSGVRVERCPPARMLLSGTDASNVQAGMWWVWPQDGSLRPVDMRENQRSFLVAASPDGRWVAYYQRSGQAPADRFVIDTWVIDVATDERFKLVEGNSPLGWIADSSAVVLAERPYMMAAVPDGEVVPTEGMLVLADAMRAAPSPNRQFRASVGADSRGSTGVSILDVGEGEVIMNLPTGRGAVELAWSPDSSQLAFTSGTDGPDGLTWQLYIADIAERSVSLLESTRDLQIHSVVWAPVPSSCS